MHRELGRSRGFLDGGDERLGLHRQQPRRPGEVVGVGLGVDLDRPIVVDLGVPYLIRIVSPAWAPLQIANSMVMSAALLVLLAVPTYEMWWYREPPLVPEE